ncbi:MAG: hypothetical protein ABJA85_05025 [Bacteroidota bacterium]
MKRVFFVCFIFSWLTTTAQNDTTYYSDLLKTADEIQLSDSLNINAELNQINLLDSITVKKWFSPILGSVNNNRLKNRNYYLAGKITSNDNFDLLFLKEEKKKSDSTSVEVFYLITTKKDGTYIASIQAAVAGIRKKSNYNTSSWLYKDYKLVLDAKYTINQKLYTDLTNYKINGGGRFILYPKD